MQNSNIHFIGYMLEKEDKEPFLDLFECKKKFFLEASKKALKYKDENTKYFPEILYKSGHKKPYIMLTPSITMSPLVKKLYQRDLRHFKSALPNKVKLSKSKLYIFIFVYTFLQFKNKFPNRSKFNIFKLLSTYKNNVNKYRDKDEILQKKLVYFFFRVKFILGYIYAKGVLNNTVFAKDDICVLWGKSYSSKILLIDHLKREDIPYVVAEYGEIPGTISFSPKGIFGEIFSVEEWENLKKKEISDEELLNTKEILNTIKTNQISTRSYDTNMYFLMKHFYNNSVKKKERERVIYVNGAELFSSALYFNRWNIGNHAQNPNKMLLEQVVNIFKDTNCMIIYKEHPMAVSQSKKSLINPSDFPTVNFIDSMNIHDILDLSDIIITYPSKVVITSLHYKKSTFVVGDFTIPYSIPEIGYYTGDKLENIVKNFYDDVEHNEDQFVEYMARMIKYSLITIDKTLHTTLNIDEQRNKINSILKQSRG